MDDVIADGMADTSLQTWLLATFAALAVVLAAVGLYSVMAFLVAQRRHEIGIRMALGAGRRDLLRLVLGHAAALIAVGVPPASPRPCGCPPHAGPPVRRRRRRPHHVCRGLRARVLVALAACIVPARRAMRVAARFVALRQE